ncbi:MAG: hypothetical protein IJU99_06410 [Lachnospiraceae bacterium]|nr:hypothetical protein [Lachnospiraceae bacterium]
MDLKQLIQSAGNADKDVFLQFKKEYFDSVRSVASEVLREEEEAELSADLTLRNAYKLLGNGVNPSVLEPWLLWLAREDALEILNHRRSLIRQEMMLKSGNLLDLYDSSNSSLLFANPEDWRLLGEPEEDDDLDDLGLLPEDHTEEAEAAPEDAPVTEPGDAPAEEPAGEETRFAEDAPADEEAADEPSEDESEEETPEDEFLPEDKEEDEEDDDPGHVREFVDDDDFEDDDQPKKHRAGSVILKILEVILVLLLLWNICGFLRSNVALPFELPDLGYGWFDEHIYPLFGSSILPLPFDLF